MEAQPLPAFISKKPKSIHPLTRQPLDLHSQRLSGGRMSCVLVAEKGALHTYTVVPLWTASQVQIRERAEKMAPRPCYGGFFVALVCGRSVLPPPCLQSVFPGRNQAGATSCLCRARTFAAAAPRFPPGTVSSTNSPLLHCHNCLLMELLEYIL